ncbi:MAG: hypothetical protein EOO78_32700, partial [Oxalobacteraceae bacterium]
MTHNRSVAARPAVGPGVLTRKVLPALLLGCFVAQPLFAQTAAPQTPPPKRPAAPAQGAAASVQPAESTATPAAAGNTSSRATSADKPAPAAGADDDMATVEVVAARPT